MTLRHLKIYLAVCETNSFTKTAEKLYITQPAVSCAIKELENYYGIKLFDRISRKLYITETGKKLLEYAVHIIALFDKMESEMRDPNIVTNLRVGSSITIGTHYMPQYVRSFKNKYPDVNVQITVNSSETIEEMIKKNELDFAFIEGVPHSADFITEKYMVDNLVIVCNPNNSICKLKKITVNRFLNEKFLLREKGSGTRQLFDNILALKGRMITPIWESTSTESLISGIEQNLGVSVLPYMLVKTQIENGKLKTIDVEGLKFTRNFNIIYHKNKFITPVALSFISICKTQQNI